MARPRFPFPTLALFAALLAAAALAPNRAGAAVSRYVGTYHAVRAGADSLQDLTLTIEASGIARMTTRYPGLTRTAAGVSVHPFAEIGRWRPAKGDTIDVSFTSEGQLADNGVRVAVGPDNTQLRLRLTDPILETVNDVNRSFTPSEPLFRKAGC